MFHAWKRHVPAPIWSGTNQVAKAARPAARWPEEPLIVPLHGAECVVESEVMTPGSSAVFENLVGEHSVPSAFAGFRRSPEWLAGIGYLQRISVMT